jgi:hypothetical protein
MQPEVQKLWTPGPRPAGDLQQVDARATTRDKGGLGIVLNIVKRRVDAHGREVDVASAGLGQGTMFTVVLPCQTLHMVSSHRSREALKLQGTRILLVEDDQDALTMLSMLLRSVGHNGGQRTGSTLTRCPRSLRPDRL